MICLLLTIASTSSTNGVTPPLTALPTSHFNNIRSPGHLRYIDSEEQRWYVGETLCLSTFFDWWFDLTSTCFESADARGRPITPPTTPPIYHPSIQPASSARRYGNMEVRKSFIHIDLQMFSNSFAIFDSACISSAQMSDATIYTMQQPHPTRQSTFKPIIKGSAKERWELGFWKAVDHLTTKNDPLPYISYYNTNVIYCK